MRFRHSWCAALAGLLLTMSGIAASADAPRPFSVGITPVFLDDQLSLLREWGRYLERHLHRPVEFVQRGSYREVVDLALTGRLDFAWICGYPYVQSGERLRLLAVPLYQGKPEYRAYLIVPTGDRTTLSIGDLRGKVFAFSDPDSNLLLNAANAVREGGSIGVLAQTTESELQIVVTNDGEPIPRERIGNLFEPFASGRPDGTGLGLWVSYQIIQQLGGQIYATSTPDHTQFTVTLPLNHEPALSHLPD